MPGLAAARAAGRAYGRPAQASSDGCDESDRSQPVYHNVLEIHPGGGVGSGQGYS
jgi:hypothetical protein